MGTRPAVSLRFAVTYIPLRIQRAVGEINDALGQESKPPDLSERLRSSVRSFEAEHPILTSVVNRVATMLSDMGI